MIEREISKALKGIVTITSRARAHTISEIASGHYPFPFNLFKRGERPNQTVQKVAGNIRDFTENASRPTRKT